MNFNAVYVLGASSSISSICLFITDLLDLSRSFLFSLLGSIEFFHSILSKAGVSLVGRALSFFLIQKGFSGGLALAIVFSARALLTSEAPAALLHFMNEDGSSAAASSSSWVGNMDIVRAPSPGGPVEIFEVPETADSVLSILFRMRLTSEAPHENHQSSSGGLPTNFSSSFQCFAPKIVQERTRFHLLARHAAKCGRGGGEQQ